MGEVRGQQHRFMVCTHIWIPHESLSILSANTWSTNEISPPKHVLKILFQRLHSSPRRLVQRTSTQCAKSKSQQLKNCGKLQDLSPPPPHHVSDPAAPPPPPPPPPRGLGCDARRSTGMPRWCPCSHITGTGGGCPIPEATCRSTTPAPAFSTALSLDLRTSSGQRPGAAARNPTPRPVRSGSGVYRSPLSRRGPGRQSQALAVGRWGAGTRWTRGAGGCGPPSVRPLGLCPSVSGGSVPDGGSSSESESICNLTACEWDA